MQISADRKLLVALAVLTALSFGLQAQAQFTAPTCVPPNCSPAVIQNIPLNGTVQNAGINISGSAKLGAMLQAGANAPVLSVATDNLIYGNVGATSANGSLLLLQFGAADRLRVSLTGQVQVPAGTVAAPSYTFLGDTNTGIFRSAVDTLNFDTNGVSRLQIDAFGNVTIPGTLAVSGTFSAASFSGDGSGLTNLNATNITSGTLGSARLPANVALLNAAQTFTSGNTFTSATNSFTGVGTGLTALNGTNITSGTVADTRLSANIPKLNANNTFTGNNTLSGMSSFGSAALVLSGAQNLLYGNVDTTSTGSLILLQNESADRFRVDAQGQVTATGALTAGGRISSVSSGGFEGFLSSDGGNNSLSMNEAQMQLIHFGTSEWLLDSSGRSWQAGLATLNGGATVGPNAYFTLTPTTLGSLPAPSNGAMYYDSGTNKFMCYASGAWSSCAGAAISGTAGHVTRFATATTLGDSVIQDNGSTVAIGNVPAAGGLLTVGPTNLGVGITASTSGGNSTAIYGIATGSTSTGLYGQGTSDGVVGISTAAGGVGVQATGQLYGVSGTVNTSNGMGVFGSVPNNSIGYGVYGVSGSNQFNSAGVAGMGSSNAMGGYFQSNTGSIYALLAYNGAGGNAFQAQGSSNFTGPVTMNSSLALSGTFRLGSYAGAPPGSTGMMYYDSSVGKFKCYEGAAWVNCIGAAAPTLDAVLTAGNSSAQTISTGALTATATGASTTAVSALGSINAGGLGVDAAGETAVRGTGKMYGGYFSSSLANGFGTYASATGAGGTALYAKAFSSATTAIFALGNVGIGAGAQTPAGKLQVITGTTLLNKGPNQPSASYANADLVLGDNQTSRDGFGQASGSNLFLQSSDKSTITALDENNNLGQISYQNLQWNLGEDVGWGAQNINMPGHLGLGTTPFSQYQLNLYGLGQWYGAYIHANGNGGSTSGTYSYADNTGAGTAIGVRGDAYGGSGATYAIFANASCSGCGTAWGIYVANGGAAKPGGGSWSSTSDARTKKDVTDFKDGLDLIRRMRPVNYTYNGLAGTPEGMQGIGFIAQEVKDLAPYLVKTTPLKLRPQDTEMTDVYSVDPSALPFIDLNAIKTLDLSINDLKAEVSKKDAEQDARIKALEDEVESLKAQLRAR